MRLAHAISLSTLAAALSGASMLAAAQQTQPAPTTQPRVLDASAPTMALQHQALAASGAIAHQPGDWKAANAAVGQFPCGHADVVQWEKAQAASPGPSPGNAASTHQHHQHGGQP